MDEKERKHTTLAFSMTNFVYDFSSFYGANANTGRLAAATRDVDEWMDGICVGG